MKMELLFLFLCVCVSGCIQYDGKRVLTEETAKFRKVVYNATSIRGIDTTSKDYKLLFVIDGRDKVDAFVSNFDIVPIVGGSLRCECSGQFIFEFYRGNEIVASMSVHHGVLLRCGDAWDCDMPLSDESSVWLCSYLGKYGTFWSAEDVKSARIKVKQVIRKQ